MDYRHLHLVAEICRHGSFGRAAKALGISQPALSKNVARLEDQLSVKLFARGKGMTQPTVFALHIVSRSRQMLGDAERIAVEIRQMATNERGSVRVGTEAVSRVGFLPSLIGDIIGRFPRLQIEIIDRQGMEVAASLAGREIDIAIADAAAVQSPDVTGFHLFSSPIVAVARPGHPLFGRKNGQSPADYPTVHINAIPRRRSAAPSSAMGSVFGPTEMVKQIVARTDATTHGPAFLFAGEVAQQSLAWLPEREKEIYRCSMLATPSALHSAVIREIIAMAQARGRAIEAALAHLRKTKVRAKRAH